MAGEMTLRAFGLRRVWPELGGKLTVAHFKTADVLPVGAMEMAVIPTSSGSEQEALSRAESAYAEECSQLPDCCLETMDCGVGEAIKCLSPYHDMIVLERLLETDGPDATDFSAARHGKVISALAYNEGELQRLARRCFRHVEC